jgi:hypothetical protein
MLCAGRAGVGAGPAEDCQDPPGHGKLEYMLSETASPATLVGERIERLRIVRLR